MQTITGTKIEQYNSGYETRSRPDLGKLIKETAPEYKPPQLATTVGVLTTAAAARLSVVVLHTRVFFLFSLMLYFRVLVPFAAETRVLSSGTYGLGRGLRKLDKPVLKIAVILCTSISIYYPLNIYNYF